MKKQMKSPLAMLFFILIVLSCGNDDNGNNACNNLPNIGINTSINLNLPEYSQLQFTANSVYVANVGNGGVIVTNTGSGFRAWDACDPNETTPNVCTILTIQGGIEAVCGCTADRTYSLITGQPLDNPDLRCSLRSYAVEQIGADLFISN